MKKLSIKKFIKQKKHLKKSFVCSVRKRYIDKIRKITYNYIRA